MRPGTSTLEQTYCHSDSTIDEEVPYTLSALNTSNHEASNGAVSRTQRRNKRVRTSASACAAYVNNDVHKPSPQPRIRGTSPRCRNALYTFVDQAAGQELQENVHMRKLSGISKALSIPNFHHSPSHDDSRPSSSPAAKVPTPLLRANSTPHYSNLQHPQKRRPPPASHSSYGIETSNGPPPSYSTQQTLSQDRAVWPQQERGRSSKPVSVAIGRSGSPAKAVTDTSDGEITRTIALPTASPSRTSTAPEYLHASSDTPQPTFPAKPSVSDISILSDQSKTTSPDTGTHGTETHVSNDSTPPTSASINMYDDHKSSSHGLEPPAQDLSTSSSSENFHDPSKNADLFLKIAKDAASTPKENVPGSRRSRISLPFLSSSRPATSMKSSPISTNFNAETIRERASTPQRFGKRSSLGSHVPGAFSSTTSYYTDTRSHLAPQTDQASNIDPSDSRSQLNGRSRRHSNAVNDSRPPSRPYQARSRLASDGLYGEKIRMQEQTQTESTISTTAPSTVWDELDDLKSRIKKLELTGKLPPSSAAAMTSDRPRTATTQATNLSSSPKHKPIVNTNALPSAIEGIPSNVHPTLHEALMNAKNTVSNDVYQKLQATTSDALQLSMMLSPDYSTNSSAVMSQSERQLRRRAESMCRSLTELTIALLAEQQNNAKSPNSRPGSSHLYQSTPTGTNFRSRRLSNATVETPEQNSTVQSRVASRLENRRTSLAKSTQEPSPRPISRAMTEAPTAYRGASRANFSREYTRQHPLPSAGSSDQTKVASSTPSQQQIGNLVSRRQAAVNDTTPEAINSSPVPFTISIQRPSHRQYPDSPASVVSEASPGTRASGRRSLGFAARVSSVSSRLKLAREQRLAATSSRDGPAMAASEVGFVASGGGNGV
ncbi:uncharacterized protein AB675_8394 [Cyphellophora attinorum]|uniref:LPXTG-motif cell wall anchor domain protein n=1 Tax=Cyphellophora attinorum TaxID=1664694 RepID=A0A0N1P1R9_9EURO|nr:uncharacterized protein AB675_8394 [Phialophora attinorum]KPI44212.1 hypothetical protein AB675_8394 [Phialophora attinorum]